MSSSPTPSVGLPEPAGIGHSSDTRSVLREALRTGRNPDGGWAYAPGRHSRIEPTCWAALALGHSDGRAPDVELLRRWTRQNGWLVDVNGAPPNNAFNALAALTLLQQPSAAALAQPLVSRLIEAKGRRLPQHEEIRQDNSLRAWPWVDGTASWVEPTAWCLLLLKKVRATATSSRDTDERIRVGEQMLFDRVCRIGGWNYGNSEVFGQELWPYVPTTALALLALQDRRGHPIVARSLAQLERDVTMERSLVAVAITIICLRAYGVATDALERTVAALTSPANPDWKENLLGTAMAVYALADPRHQVAFTVPDHA